MIELLYFLAWTFFIYWIHRLVHMTPILKKIHGNHHAFINNNTSPKWHWNNLFLFNDNRASTLDLWITEVIPTIIFCYITMQWWILVFYYIWASLIQETIEHNPAVDIYPILPSGSYHLIHHTDSTKNFGAFTVVWDILFKTSKHV